MMLSALRLILYILKILWGIVILPINKYRELNAALKDGKLELEERCKQLSIENQILQDQIFRLEERSRLLHAEKELLRKRLDEVTANMAHVMMRENKGGFESPSDPFNPTKIAKKFTKLYEEQALSIVELFGDDEINGVEFVSNIMQESYKFCRQKADVQIQAFTSASPQDDNHQDEDAKSDNVLHNVSQILTDTEINDLYLLRWKAAASETFRKQIRKGFNNIATNNIDEIIKLRFQDNQSKTILMRFIGDCAEISWLIATCHPPLKMNFDAKHKIYDGWIQRNFRKYTTKTALVIDTYPKGLVICVAWPALVSADDSLLHQRGEIIAID